MKLLRKTIRKLIREAIRMDEDLMVIRHKNLFILADCAYMDDYPVHPVLGGEFHEDHFRQHFMKGMLQLRGKPDDHCHDAMEVMRIATLDGYGPTMYDVVMELTDRPLINDRGSVSSEAESVMQFYKDRRPDVEKKLLDNIWDRAYGKPTDAKPHPGKTPDPNDDCTPGDSRTFRDGHRVGSHSDDGQAWEDDPFSYAYNKSMSPRAKEMLDKGNQFIKDYDLEDFDFKLLRAASYFFRERY